MSNWQFNRLKVTDDSLEVTGPATLTAEEQARLVGDVVVRFLLIQDPEEGSTDPVWRFDGVAGLVAAGTWGRTYDTFPPGLRAGKVRGIATAVMILDPPSGTPAPVPPPSFDTVTWCVTIDVDDQRT
jgi:hypothetical protein